MKVTDQPVSTSFHSLRHLTVCIAWIEGFAIFVAVFVVAFVGSWNDY